MIYVTSNMLKNVCKDKGIIYNSYMNKSAFILLVIGLFILFFVNEPLDPLLLYNAATFTYQNNAYESMYFPHKISIQYQYVSDSNNVLFANKKQIINYDYDAPYFYIYTMENDSEDYCWIYSENNNIYFAHDTNGVKEYYYVPCESEAQGVGYFDYLVQFFGFNKTIETYFKGLEQLQLVIDSCKELIHIKDDEQQNNLNILSYVMNLYGYFDEDNINVTFTIDRKEDKIFFYTYLNQTIKTIFNNGYLVHYLNESTENNFHEYNGEKFSDIIHCKTEITIQYNEFSFTYPDLSDGFKNI